MPDYTALVTKWSTFNGSSLSTLQRLQSLNNTMIPSPTPAPMIIPTYKIFNLMASSEVAGLSSANLATINQILGMGTVDVSIGTQARARMSVAVAGMTQTIVNLIALSTGYDNPLVSLVTASTTIGGLGLPSALNMNDLAAAGGLT